MAELIVRKKESDTGLATEYEYEFRSSSADGAGPLEQEYGVDPAPTMVSNLCKRIDNIVEDALGPTPVISDPASELASASQLLYDNLFPRLDGNIPDLAQRIRQAEGPLLIRTNESLIPWELLHDGEDFLCLAHEVGRRTFVKSRVAGGRTIGRVTRALIVGDPNSDLGSARREAEALAEWLRDRDVECKLLLGEQATLLEVVGELVSGRYDLLHYCGHVAAPAGTQFVGLRLHGDELLDGRALRPVANAGAPPIVFINGCASAERVANLCVSFMTVGAKVVVGTRYDVEEEAARRFAERFYTDFISGSSAGTAIRAARHALRRPDCIDWAAFVLYGDPAVRISAGEAPPMSPPVESGYRMDQAATELWERVVRQAAGRGVVTSIDLLIELMSTQDIVNQAKNGVGAERLAVVSELLRTIIHIGSNDTADTDAKVEHSDTVATVLARAERRAQESGRELITTGDLVAAFIAVGGGTSRHLLDLFGMSLADLIGDPTDSTSTSSAATSSGSRALPINGKRAADGHGSAGPAGSLLFEESGRLRTERLDPTMVAAIRVAAMLASAQRSVISTSMVLYGLGVADSQALREALREQGDVGAAAFERLSMSADTQWRRFSPRTLRALERAASKPETNTLRDSDVLPEIISDKSSTARIMLGRLGVDPDRLCHREHQDGAGTAEP